MTTLSGNRRERYRTQNQWCESFLYPCQRLQSGCSCGIKCLRSSVIFLLNVKRACIAVITHIKVFLLVWFRHWPLTHHFPLHSWCHQPRGSVWSGTSAIRQRCPCTRVVVQVLAASEQWPGPVQMWAALSAGTVQGPGDRREPKEALGLTHQTSPAKKNTKWTLTNSN